MSIGNSRFVLVKNGGAVKPNAILTVGKVPYPFLRDRAPTNRGAWLPINDAFAWRLVEQLLNEGHEPGEPEANVVGLHAQAVC